MGYPQAFLRTSHTPPTSSSLGTLKTPGLTYACVRQLVVGEGSLLGALLPKAAYSAGHGGPQGSSGLLLQRKQQFWKGRDLLSGVTWQLSGSLGSHAPAPLLGKDLCSLLTLLELLLHLCRKLPGQKGTPRSLALTGEVLLPPRGQKLSYTIPDFPACFFFAQN